MENLGWLNIFAFVMQENEMNTFVYASNDHSVIENTKA